MNSIIFFCIKTNNYLKAFNLNDYIPDEDFEKMKEVLKNNLTKLKLKKNERVTINNKNNGKWLIEKYKKNLIIGTYTIYTYKDTIAYKCIKESYAKYKVNDDKEIYDILVKYNNINKVDTVSRISSKVDYGNETIKKNFEKALIIDNDIAQLDDTVKENIKEAQNYYNNTNKLDDEMKARNRRFKKIIFFIILSLLFCIIFVVLSLKLI